MADEESSWWDSATETVSDAVDTVTDAAESVADFGAGLYDRAVDSVTHSARGIEEQVDADRDGSVLDDMLSGAVGAIPVVGDWLESSAGAVAEELGDFATDAMGTRHQGLFSEESTLDVENTTDGDYRGDGSFQGVGQYLNDELGIGENNPADILEGIGTINDITGQPDVYGALGEFANDIRGNEDPYMENGDYQPVE